MPFIARLRFREVQSEHNDVNRRGFLQDERRNRRRSCDRLLSAREFEARGGTRATDPKLNAFVRVGTDDSVTLTIHRAELGQGSMTALSMLLAEELECDWSKIHTEFAKVDPANYGVFGSPVLQGVFGSLSIRGSWDQLRQAGATAREMLIGRRRAAVGRRQIPMQGREKHGYQHRNQCAPELWEPGRSRGENAAARGKVALKNLQHSR